ncbi:MAG: D-2-hydroxyacid dehydrogenase [Candidatus Izemoplasma sp.]|nr:D-2-hydroxyacid dehydrogenase [Candidatus Izemoplasma sp.]
MIVLANDGIDSSAKETLEEMGYTVEVDHYDGEALIEKIQEIDCIIVRSATKLRQPIIDKALETRQLKLIIRAGVGIDNIDHVYAEEQGIKVMNTPNSSSAAVAELALGHMFALARHIYIANVTMREGRWEKKQYRGIELNGKTLGLVGFGRIARSLAKKAMALGMSIIYYDKSDSVTEVDGCQRVDKETLLQTADFISLHIPFIKQDGPFLDREAFKQMKKGMYLIHTARGGVVDETALLDALDAGIVKRAALDVYEDEPVKNMRIYTHDKISLTPHIGAATYEAQARIGLETIEVIKQYLA